MTSTGGGVHLPVMVEEVVLALKPAFSGTLIDCTVDGGGHAEALLEAMQPRGRLIGIDRDHEMLEAAARRLERFGDRVNLVDGNFGRVAEICRGLGVTGVSGVFFDLGLSSLQLQSAERGFSFQREGPLDMRMDTRTGRTAGDLVNQLSEGELADIFNRLGEEPHARAIAKSLVLERRKGPIQTTRQLAQVVTRAVPPARRRGRVHPATKVFQALRIAVNDELGMLRSGLLDAWTLLGPSGRVCVISYHSLEDRLVKDFLNEKSSSGGRLVTKKAVLPSREELMRNPAARSSRLRCAERLG